MSSNQFGNVYIFNLYSVPVSKFNLNGQGSAGAIKAPSAASAAPYTPQQLVVARTNQTSNQLDSPLFVVGDNQITVNYQGQNWKGTINIPSNIPLQSDLWLYLAFGQMFLFLTTGEIVPQVGGGGLQMTKGGAATSLSAQLTKQGSAKQGPAKKGAAKKGSSKKGAAKKGAAKKSSSKSK
jgi:hypothetical protein